MLISYGWTMLEHSEISLDFIYAQRYNNVQQIKVIALKKIHYLTLSCANGSCSEAQTSKNSTSKNNKITEYSWFCE